VTNDYAIFIPGNLLGVAFLLLQYYPLGNLMKYLQTSRSINKGYDPQIQLGWSHQLANAMAYLSSKKVVHGDLATRNILLSSPTDIKVTDFGLSRKIYDYRTYARGAEEVRGLNMQNSEI